MRPWEVVDNAYVVDVSQRCHNGCPYCFAAASPQGPILDRATAATIATRISRDVEARGEAVRVSLFGCGEPTENWDGLVHFIRCLRGVLGQRLRMHLTTNGQLTAAQLRWLGQNLNSLTVSLDGPASLHDRQRPGWGTKGSHARAVRTILELRHLSLEVSCTVIAARKERIAELIDYFERDFSGLTVRLQPHVNFGPVREYDVSEDAFLDPRLVGSATTVNRYAIGDLLTRPKHVRFKIRMYIGMNYEVSAFVVPVKMGRTMTRLNLGRLEDRGIALRPSLADEMSVRSDALARACAGCACEAYCSYDRPDIEFPIAPDGSAVMSQRLCAAYRAHVCAASHPRCP